MTPRILFLLLMAVGLSLLFGVVFVNRDIEEKLSHHSLTPVVFFEGGSSEAPITPVISEDTLNSREVALGEQLFQDKRLSGNDTVSCTSCHNLTTGGTDGRRVPLGMGQRPGTRNVPTVFNCSLNYKQFWDGRAASLADQMDEPLKSADEMHSDWNEVVEKISQDERLVRAFRTVYPDGLQPGNIKKALAVYERSLTTPDSRFDLYLKGDKKALTARELDGYHLLISAGCISCHQGSNIGGNMMQHFGVMNNSDKTYTGQKRDWTTDHGILVLPDTPDDSPLFKVPSLRNVARTAPYFHDGSEPSLREAVKIMGYSQLGRSFSEEQVNALVAFLNTLTGKYQGKPL